MVLRHLIYKWVLIQVLFVVIILRLMHHVNRRLPCFYKPLDIRRCLLAKWLVEFHHAFVGSVREKLLVLFHKLLHVFFVNLIRYLLLVKASYLTTRQRILLLMLNIIALSLNRISTYHYMSSFCLGFSLAIWHIWCRFHILKLSYYHFIFYFFGIIPFLDFLNYLEVFRFWLLCKVKACSNRT